jgi:hypothetical protein
MYLCFRIFSARFWSHPLSLWSSSCLQNYKNVPQINYHNHDLYHHHHHHLHAGYLQLYTWMTKLFIIIIIIIIITVAPLITDSLINGHLQ